MDAMQAHRCNWLRALIGGLLAVCVLGATSAVTSAQGDSAAARKLPPNYRQLMAQYITVRLIVPRLRGRFQIRDVKISRPHPKAGGLFSSTLVPAVCVVLYRDNPFGYIVTENFVMTIDGGRVRELPTINLEACPGYSTFHELLPR